MPLRGSAEAVCLGGMAQETLMIGWTTVDSEGAAEVLARGAVDAGLAACAQVDGPVRSFYEWKGKVCDDREWRVPFKFAEARAGALESWLGGAHAYDTPQWVVCRADRVAEAYRKWVLEQCMGAGGLEDGPH